MAAGWPSNWPVEARAEQGIDDDLGASNGFGVSGLSLSCRLPPALTASWLPSLKSRIVLDQVAVRASATQSFFGAQSCRY